MIFISLLKAAFSIEKIEKVRPLAGSRGLTRNRRTVCKNTISDLPSIVKLYFLGLLSGRCGGAGFTALRPVL